MVKILVADPISDSGMKVFEGADGGRFKLDARKNLPLDELKKAGVQITGDYVCFHHPESKIEGYGACECRKPSPFFIAEAARKYGVELRRSWMVGDQDTDVVTGINAGCRTALLNYEHSANKRGKTKPDLICADLAEFVRKLD